MIHLVEDLKVPNPYFELKNGHIFVIAETPGGIYNPIQVKKILELLEKDVVFLKATEDHRIGFMIAPDQISPVETKLLECGIQLRHYRNQARLSPKACLGELCPKHKQKSLEDSIDLSEDLYKKMKENNISLDIGINGCEEACVTSATNDIHLVGNDEGYEIYLGGKSTQYPELSILAYEPVPKNKLKDVLSGIIDVYCKNKKENNTLKDLIEEKGIQLFSDAIDVLLNGEKTINVSEEKEEKTDIKPENSVALNEDEKNKVPSDLPNEEQKNEEILETEKLVEEPESEAELKNDADENMEKIEDGEKAEDEPEIEDKLSVRTEGLFIVISIPHTIRLKLRKRNLILQDPIEISTEKGICRIERQEEKLIISYNGVEMEVKVGQTA